MQEMHFGWGKYLSPASVCYLLMTCLKNLGTLHFGVVATLRVPNRRCVALVWVAYRGAVTFPATLSEYSPASSNAGVLLNVRT